MPSTLTRGPLPARVYWTRRLVVAGLAFGLVFALAHLLGGGSDAASKPQARQAAARTTVTPTEPTTSAAPTVALPTGPATRAARHQKRHAKPTPPPLAEPEGTCSDDDVAVTPAVPRAFAGQPVTLVMKLRTIESPACTWSVSPDSLTVKITSGSDDIWFSRECTRAIPREDVIVRNTQNTRVEMTWSGRRSDDTCSRLTDWAMPGWYHVSAAAYAGEPSDAQFRLRRPEAQVVTKTVKPEPKGSKNQDSKKQSKSQKRD